jgi:hypothetical protein
MKKFNILLSMSLLALFILSFNACKKEETENAKPAISALELGYNNSHTVVLGSDLHIEAEVVAEGKIQTIQIEIHAEGGDKGSWIFDSVYTEFAGLKNTTFHKHVDLPLDTDPGHYHFHFIVTDQEGQQTTLEEVVEVVLPSDSVAPVLQITVAPSNGQLFINGQSIQISGDITDNIALGGLYIGLVSSTQSLTDAEVNHTNTITLLHGHDFDQPTQHHFEASIVVGAAYDNNSTPKPIQWQSGSYYILVKTKDAFGGNWTYSTHYPIQITISK